MKPASKAAMLVAAGALGYLAHQQLGPVQTEIVEKERVVIVPDVPPTVTVEKPVPAVLSEACTDYLYASIEGTDSAGVIAAAGPKVSLIIGEIQQLSVNTVGNDPGRLVELQQELNLINMDLTEAIQELGNPVLHPLPDNPCLEGE